MKLEIKVKNVFNSLNKYYFDDKLYKEYFITFERIKNDILNSLFDPIKISIKNYIIGAEMINITNDEITIVFQNQTTNLNYTFILLKTIIILVQYSYYLY